MKNSTVKLFSSIRNNQGTRQLFVKNKNIKFCNNILKILICKGFINSYLLKGSQVKIFLKYYNDKPVIFKNILLNSKSSFITYISLCKLNKNVTFKMMRLDFLHLNTVIPLKLVV